jgi:hypothetical protein
MVISCETAEIYGIMTVQYGDNGDNYMNWREVVEKNVNS